MAGLFETALRAETGADLAYYDERSVAGRLRAGVIHEGDIYALESWQEAAEVVEVRGALLSATLVAALRERGLVPNPAKTYSVATTAYGARQLEKKLGRIEGRRSGPLLRDLTVSYLRSHAFRS